MASLLDKLGSDEAILLVYLADELPAEDRAQVERRLVAEPALQAELGRLRDLQSFIRQTLNAAELPRKATGDDAAVRRIARAMRRQQLEWMARPRVEQTPSRTWPRWVHSVGAAAAVVFLLIGLWGMGVFDLEPQPQLDGQPSIAVVTEEDPTEAVAMMLEEKWLSQVTAGEWALDEAAEHAAELQSWDDEDPLLLLMMM